jgi:hypothetical protein
MPRIFAIALVIIFSVSCKNQEQQLSGDKPVKPENFLKAFRSINMPIVIWDTGLARFGDTSVISYAVLSQFIPDSVLTAQAGSQANDAVIHPAGLIHNQDNDYLLAKFSSGKKNKLFVFVLNTDHRYVSSLSLLAGHDPNDPYHRSVSITV